MANKTLNVTVIQRNDTATNWTNTNPKPSKGEMCVEIDTGKFKFGDGVHNFNDLDYAGSGNQVVADRAPTVNDMDYDVGTLWVHQGIAPTYDLYVLMYKSDLTALWRKVCIGSVIAESLKTARNITIKGAVVQTTQSFNGSQDISFTLELNASGVTAGTYPKVTVNSKGLVTGGASLTANDIPTISNTKVSGLGTASTKNTGTGAGNVPILDTNGKLDTSVLPALAISETFTVASEAAMLTQNAQRGDIAIRTDINKTFILTADGAGTLSNWKELKTPDCKVSSINNKTGAVSLSTNDISEGSNNKYYTQARFDNRFGEKSYMDLDDGDKLISEDDSITLNGGNA